MFYQKERELQQDLTFFDFGFAHSSDVTFVRREVSVGGCIPDLICIHFNNFPFEQQWPKPWTYEHAYIMWLLRQHCQLSVDSMASFSFQLADRLSPVIKDLVKHNLLVEDEYANFTLSTHIMDLQVEVVAIEAKLKLWKKALHQAERYKQFSNRAFVAMDADAAPRDPFDTQVFREKGIGLCAVSPGEIEWIVHPKKWTHPIDHQGEYLVTSTMVPSLQMLWSSRNLISASNQD